MNDWTRELRSISDFCDETNVVPDASNKICKRKFKPSLYDYYDSDEDDIEVTETKDQVENLEYPKYRIGRGYLIQKQYNTKMVGGTSTDLDFGSDTTKSIRSVSNVDYSNDKLENTFNGHNKKVLNEQFFNCVHSAALVDKEVFNEEKTPEIEKPPLPLSELLKDCRKAKKQVKLNKSSLLNKTGKGDESAVYLNGKIEMNLKHRLKDEVVFDFQSPDDFPSLS